MLGRMPRRFYTSRKRAYRRRRDALQATFPAAFDFLRGLELLCDGEHGFHMGTAQHVQLYFGELFLCHLAILGAEGEAARMELSPRHHGRLKEGTRDAAHVLFRARIHGLLELLGVPASAVMRRDDVYQLSDQTPLTFFRLLQAELLDIAASADTQPWQQELFARPARRKKKRKRKTADPREQLLEQAADAEAEVAGLVRALEAELRQQLTVALDADGAVVRLVGEGSNCWRAESLAEAVAACLASAVEDE